MADRPGKTAPLLLHNLIHYDPRREHLAGRNILTSSPPHFDPRVEPRSAVPPGSCMHKFLEKHEQTSRTLSGGDDSPLPMVKIASYCSECRWHFDVVVDYREDGHKNRACGKSRKDWPLHHFVLIGPDQQDEDPVVGRHLGRRNFTFRCSAPQCPVTLHVGVRPPIFTKNDIHLLTDPAVLRHRWETAKRIAGERADNSMARSIDALDFLCTYLQDSLNPQKGKTQIPLLNRKFLKTFGTDCNDILTRLHFTSSVELDSEGNSIVLWHLPTLHPAQHPLDYSEPTRRNVIEDARYELNAIILRRPESERTGTRHVPMYPIASQVFIEKALECDDYEKVKGRTETRGRREEDHPYYAGLGAKGDFSDSLLLFAYHRQVAVDSLNGPYYFECLQEIAAGRTSEQLQMEVATLASRGCINRAEVITAYQYFGIDPQHTRVITDEHIIGVFRSRLSDISPSAIEEARRQLRIIGQARNSDTLVREASDAIETYDQALSWLGLDKDQADDFVPTMFSLKTSDNPTSEETARKAVSIIAEHRRSQRLQYWLKYGQMPGGEMDAGEAYAILDIPDRTAKLDLQVLEEMANVQIQSNPENAARLQEAYARVREDQENMHGRSPDYQQPSTESHPLETWPVGCCNIGNTCYLNSVLQFLFTITPLRDRVLNCDEFLQELTPEALAAKRVGRTEVSLSRAETGQRFVRELQKLFELMISSPTHNIRPERTLAALALTRGEHAEDTVVADSSTNHSGLGDIGGLPVSGPMLPPQGFSSSRPPTPADSVMGDNDAKSDSSSMKAMDLTIANEPAAASNTPPEPPSRPPPIPPRRQGGEKAQASNENGFRKIEEVARQQDAAEILNNVFDLLSCAFKGESTLRDGEQFDMIKRLFFSDVTTVRITNGTTASKTDLQDNIHVSTKDRDRTLYAALDDEFGQTELEGGVTKYEFFEEASPIQIINVRRLQYENGRPRKDNSHLALEKVLYLDRYLKSTKSLSQEQLQALRNEQWRLQANLRSLEAKRKALKETPFEKVDLPGALDESAALLEKFKGDACEPIAAPHDINADDLSNQLTQRSDELRPEVADIDSKMDKLEKDIDSVFENCRDHPYRLHAIFMHAGSHSGGHYWIYIYDFQNGIWRKYNDETVTTETEENILSKVDRENPPTSTGIVYVREDVVNKYTEAVCRKPEATPEANTRQDVEMQDVGGYSQPVFNMDTDYKDLEVINGVEQKSRNNPPVGSLERLRVGKAGRYRWEELSCKRHSISPARSPSPEKKAKLYSDTEGSPSSSPLSSPLSDDGFDPARSMSRLPYVSKMRRLAPRPT